MGHLAIQILGPLALWDVDDDGVWHPMQISTGGGAAGFLSVFVFCREDIKDWSDVAAYLWDSASFEPGSSMPPFFRTHMSRLRKQLEPHAAVLSQGRMAPGLSGPASQVLQVDWWDFLDYKIAERYETALSLFNGLPLQNVKEGDLDMHQLRCDITKEVAENVYECLTEIEAPYPDSLDVSGPLLRQFAEHLPPEWDRTTPSARPSRVPALSAPTPAPAARPARPPRLCGAFEAADLFESCPKGEQRLALELNQAEEEGTHTWWSKGEWLGKFFAFWLKMNTRRCEEIALTLTDDVYDSARFDLSGKDMPKDKATILEAPSFFSDNPEKEIKCGLTNWGLAYEWASRHGYELLAHPSRPSVFGVAGRPAYPGIAGVHTLVQTSDGYVLFGLRAPDIAFHERTWSATFEEQVAVGAREFTGPLGGDATLRDVIEGGLYEEWGIEEDAVELTSCLAIGREWGCDPYRGKPMLNLSATIITACRLNISLADVWASLDESAGIEDVEEHRAWAGIQFASRNDVLRFVAFAKGRKDNQNILEEGRKQSDIEAELKLYPRGVTTNIRDRGLMPTSAARLVLASGWFETLQSLDNSH